MKRRLFGIMVTLLTILAFANIASASTVLNYQPEVPEALKK